MKSYEIEISGIKFRTTQTRPKKRSNPYLTLETKVTSLAEFRISSEGEIDRFFKKVKFSNEYQTGDPSFDSKFYLQSEDPIFLSEFLRYPEVKECFLNLAEHNMTSLTISRGKLKVVINPHPYTKEEDPSVAEIARTVSMIIPKIPQSTTAHSPIGQTSSLKPEHFRYTPFAIAVVGFILFFMGLASYTLLDGTAMFLYSLKYSFPTFLLYIFLCYKTVQNRSDSHRILLLNFICASIGIVILFLGGLTCYNGAFDRSISKDHTSVITRKWRSGKKNRSRSISFASFSDPNKIYSLKINNSEFDKITENQSSVKITYREGALNFPWLEKYSLE